MINKTIKPILFNTEDVKAILDGKKNKTARVFSKTQLKYFDYAQKLGEMSSLDNLHEDDFAYILQFSQYKVGDILYVREKSYFVDCDCQSPWQWLSAQPNPESPDFQSSYEQKR